MDIFLPVIVFGAAAGFALAFGAGRGCPVRWARLLHGAAALATLAALGRFLVQVAGWLPAGSTANSYDFQVFYAAAEAARAWAPLYDLAGIRRDPGEIVVYRHAPIGAVLFVPWTLLPYQVALNGWRLLNVAVYAATLWTFLRHFEIHWRSPLALALAAVWFASTPSRDSLALGQWDALFLSMFLTLLVALTTRRDRDLLGGAFLSLPITLKFFPVLLLLGPFVARRWRIFAGCLLGGVTLLIVGLLAGPQNTLVFVRDVAPVVGGGTLYAENQTLYAFVGRLLASELSGKGFGATYPVDLTRWLSRLLALPIVLVTALVAWRRGGGELGAALRFVLPLPAALLIVPTAWAHYATLALLPLAVLAVALSRLTVRWYALLLFALAALIIPLGSEREIWGEGRSYEGPIRLLLTYKVYGLLALWAALALVAWRIKPAPYSGPERRRGSLLFGRVSGW
jgi:hypothetical protein